MISFMRTTRTHYETISLAICEKLEVTCRKTAHVTGLAIQYRAISSTSDGLGTVQVEHWREVVYKIENADGANSVVIIMVTKTRRE